MIGVIGGMGVQATALFYDKLVKNQRVEIEQDYADILIYSKSSIPDRTAYITGVCTQSPLPALLHAVEVLQNAGVKCIAVPCITSHFFYEDLARAATVPVLNVLEETAKHVAAAGIYKVGLLATTGTVQGKFFHDALARHQVEALELDAENQARLMDLIYGIKKSQPVDASLTENLADLLYTQGAQGVILGCTELNVVAQNHKYIDALEILATAALTYKD